MPVENGDKVWIVLEGPDMGYYGTAEIHGVFLTEDEAKARAHAKFPDWAEQSYEPITVEGWTVGEVDR
jgi:hypothetical protein